MEQQFLRKVCFVFVGFILFALFTMVSDGGLTGLLVLSEGARVQVEAGFQVLIVGIVVLFFLLINKGNVRGAVRSLVGAAAVYAGLFAISRIIPSVEVLAGAVSLTFGVMAMIWVLRARRVLSAGSSLRSYTTVFFFCLVFIVAFSLYDLAGEVFGLGVVWVYPKYVVLTVAYLFFVYAAFKIRRIGDEFGFFADSSRVREELRAKKVRTGRGRRGGS